MERDAMDFVREAEEAKEPEEKKCVICGRPLAGCLEGWTQNDVCSGRCWADLFGEP